LIALDGQKTELIHDWAGLEGLAWSRDGSEVWFTGSNSLNWSMYAVGGKRGLRPVWRVPGNLILYDVDRNGRVLVADAGMTSTVRAMGAGEQREHDLSIGWSNARALTSDGKNALVVCYSGDAAYYDLYLRPSNGGPATRIGEGEPLGFSADGKWALSMILSSPPKLVLYGTDSEATKPIDLGGLKIVSADLTPDGRLLLVAATPRGPEYYLQDLDGAHRSKLPIDHPISGRALVSPDGSKVVVNGRSSGMSRVYSLTGQILRDAPAPLTVIGWSSDSRSLFVYSKNGFPLKVQRGHGRPRSVEGDHAHGHRRSPRQIHVHHSRWQRLRVLDREDDDRSVHR
jgi:hypothetical protein